MSPAEQASRLPVSEVAGSVLAASPEDGEERQVQVAIPPMSGCGRCGERGCGLTLFEEQTMPVRLWCRDTLGAVPGQRVRIEVAEPPAGRISQACVLYALATLGLVAGGVLAAWMATALNLPRVLDGDLSAIVGAAGGLLLGLRCGRYYERRLLSRLAGDAHRSSARVIAILEAPGPDEKPVGRDRTTGVRSHEYACR